MRCRCVAVECLLPVLESGCMRVEQERGQEGVAVRCVSAQFRTWRAVDNGWLQREEGKGEDGRPQKS